MTKHWVNALGVLVGTSDDNFTEFPGATADVGTVRPDPHMVWDFQASAWVDAPDAERKRAILELSATDTEMARVVDDLVAFVVDGTPMPLVAKDKVAARKAMRAKL